MTRVWLGSNESIELWNVCSTFFRTQSVLNTNPRYEPRKRLPTAPFSLSLPMPPLCPPTCPLHLPSSHTMGSFPWPLNSVRDAPSGPSLSCSVIGTVFLLLSLQAIGPSAPSYLVSGSPSGCVANQRDAGSNKLRTFKS